MRGVLDPPTLTAPPAVSALLPRVEFVDGPWMPENGRVCLLHDTARRRWGATARLAATGLRLGSALDCPDLLAGIGPVLADRALPGGVDRASVLIRTTGPGPRSPEHATHDAFLTVSAPDAALRRATGGIGRGAHRRATVLYAALSALSRPLQSLGLDTPQWLDGPALVDALHLAVTDGGDRGYDGVGVRAGRDDDAGRRFVHGGYATVSWVVLAADEGTLPFDALPPLLAGPDHGERRSLTVHYQAAHPVPARSPAGGTSTGAAASSPVRCGAVVAVTLPADRDVDVATEAVEAAATVAPARLALHRLELAQDSGYVAAALPVGIGLDHLRIGR